MNFSRFSDEYQAVLRRFSVTVVIEVLLLVGCEFGKMVFWEGYASDEAKGMFALIVVYWVYAGFYQLLPPLDKFRLHTRKEEDEKNLAPLSSVIKGVLVQQFFQAAVAHVLFLVGG